jgi:hypothetical protein
VIIKAILLEEFIKRTRWFEITDTVCQKPTRIVINKRRRSERYTKIDIIREESTVKCKIKGLRSEGN